KLRCSPWSVVPWSQSPCPATDTFCPPIYSEEMNRRTKTDQMMQIPLVWSLVGGPVVPHYLLAPGDFPRLPASSHIFPHLFQIFIAAKLFLPLLTMFLQYAGSLC